MKPNRFRFRAWCITEKKMYEEPIFVNSIGIVTPATLNSVLMQSTGLTDKNGKEIFEGDIMTGGSWDTLQIVWISESAAFGCKLLDKKQYVFPNMEGYFDAHVIGNIYENKELFK